MAFNVKNNIDQLYSYFMSKNMKKEAGLLEPLIYILKVGSNQRAIVFVDLDETFIANFRQTKNEIIEALDVNLEWDLEDAEDDGLPEEEIDKIKERFDNYKKQISQDLIRENEKRSIMIRPLFVKLIREISNFADIYVLTASTKDRANLIKDLMPNDVKSLVKGWFSSRIRENISFDKSLSGRPYVLIDDNRNHSSDGNQTKHKLIQGEDPESILLSEEEIDIEDYHVYIKGFGSIEEQNFDYSRVLNEVKSKIEKQQNRN